MDATNVTAGKPNTGGAVYRAPLSSSLTLPSSTVTDMSTLTAFKELGYVSDAGVVNSNNPSSNDIKAWGGNNVLNTQTDKPDTFKFTLLEVLKIDVLKAVYGSDNVTEDSSTHEITVKANADEGEYGAWVIDMIMRGGKAKRVVIPNAKIANIEDITYSDTAAVGYGITLSCMPDSAGNTHYEYIL